MENKINNSFESSFISRSLENEILLCDRYELVPLFKEYLGPNQPILEAGCGTGRWVVWFTKLGWQSSGIDWSYATIEKARELYPECSFNSGDIRKMNFNKNSFKSIVALGTIEHDANGPIEALSEFYRVVENQGVIVITVPFGSLIHKTLRPIYSILQHLMSNYFVRKLFNKYSIEKNNYKNVKDQTKPQWNPIYSYDKDGWFFYEYRFTKKQMRTFLLNSGFNIIKEKVTFKEDGIYLNFGRLVGIWDYEKGKVQFNNIGNFLNSILPLDWVGGHLCYILSKQSS